MTQQAFLDIAQRLASLPADKKKVFRQRLAEKGIDSWRLPIVPAMLDDGEPRPLAQAQRRFLSAEALSSRALYNLCSVLRFDGRLDGARLQQAMQQVVDRHQILRTRYSPDASGQLQPHCAPQQVQLPGVERLTVAASEHEQWCADEYARQLAEPFDLAQSMPWRWQAFSDAQEHSTWLFFTIHHVAYDAWSAQQLTLELAEAYRALASNQAVALPELSIQYADYAAWEREWLDSDSCQQHIDFWRDQLADAPAPMALPLDRPRPWPHDAATVARFWPGTPAAPHNGDRGGCP